jgi:hypothetical protein
MLIELDIHVEIAKLHNQIKNHLGLSADNLIFDYKANENQMILNLITINPKHNQSFLYQSISGTDKLDAAKKLWDYVRGHNQNINSFTIQWIADGDKELHTSYFKANNMYEALDKLYFGRDMNTISVFSIVLNPVS